jgi:hypothetical protein
VSEKFKDRPNFRGLTWKPLLNDGWWIPGFTDLTSLSRNEPLTYSYDDATMARFAKDTGVAVPVDARDPQRFQKRYDFLTSPAMRERWVAWRCEKMHDFYLKVTDKLRAQRKDAEMFLSLYVNVSQATQWTSKNQPVRDYMRERGYDLALYGSDPGLRVTRWAHHTLKYTPAYRVGGYAAGWEQSVGPEFIDYYGREKTRAVLIMHHWDELGYRALFSDDAEIAWPVTGNNGRFHVQANGENAREPFTQALIASDPETVMYGFMDISMIVGQEQQFRDFARVLRSLPVDTFQLALGTGFETNLAIRELRKGKSYYFYVANPGYWSIKGSIALTGRGKVRDLTDDSPVATTQQGGRTVVPVDLKPFGLAAFRVDGAVKVASWQNEPLADANLTHMRGIIADGEKILAQAPPSNPEDPTYLKNQAYLRETVSAAKDDLAHGAYARAWNRLTNWRYWRLVRDRNR